MKTDDTGVKQLAIALAMADTDLALSQLSETVHQLSLGVSALQQQLAAAKLAVAEVRKEVEDTDGSTKDD